MRKRCFPWTCLALLQRRSEAHIDILPLSHVTDIFPSTFQAFQGFMPFPSALCQSLVALHSAIINHTRSLAGESLDKSVKWMDATRE
jgi:hypothetical protein